MVTQQHEVLRRSSGLKASADYISIPQAIEFPTEDGLTAHAFYYLPYNRDYVAQESDQPPLLVLTMVGQTAATTAVFDMHIQYWTSRGIAVLHVNYGGSTGYGRAFRQRLNGQWGIVDVDDCVNAARYLVNRGEVDNNRLAIAGGSSRADTTLCALTFRDVFSAGASYYGVADLETFAMDTHKFESHYLDNLIGPYPEQRNLYVERSPIHHIDLLSCPLILFQGLVDEVVHRTRQRKCSRLSARRDCPSAICLSRASSTASVKPRILNVRWTPNYTFTQKYLALKLADPVEPVSIDNL